MKNKKLFFKIGVRNAGHRSQYYTLRVTNEDGEVVKVHTSKSRAYLNAYIPAGAEQIFD